MTEPPQTDETLRAERDRALTALRDVMRTLEKSAASPLEARVYNHARAVLAEHGLDAGQEYLARAAEAWARRGQR